MSFEIPGVLWRRDPLGAEVPLVFELAAQRVALPRGFPLFLPPRSAAHRRGRLCRRALCGRPGTRRNPDRRGVPAQLSRPQPGCRRPRHRADRGTLAVRLSPPRIRQEPGSGWCAVSPARASRFTIASSRSPRSCRGSSGAIPPTISVLDEACERVHRKFGVGLACQLPFDAVTAQREEGRALRRFCPGRSRRDDLRAGIHRFCRARLARPRIHRPHQRDL